jgi:hypothetical protein
MARSHSWVTALVTLRPKIRSMRAIFSLPPPILLLLLDEVVLVFERQHLVERRRS